MQVRECRPADAEAVAPLLGELGYPSGPESLVTRLMGLADRSDCKVLLAEDSSGIRGVGAVHVFPTLHADEPVALITALVVSEASRGKGIGGILVDALEEFARGCGSERIVVTTANRRTGAHRFYEHLGYTFTGRRYVKRPL